MRKYHFYYLLLVKLSSKRAKISGMEKWTLQLHEQSTYLYKDFQASGVMIIENVSLVSYLTSR